MANVGFNGTDSSFPVGGVIQTMSGTLYGVTAKLGKTAGGGRRPVKSIPLPAFPRADYAALFFTGARKYVGLDGVDLLRVQDLLE